MDVREKLIDLKPCPLCSIKWLNNLKNDIGDARHSDLWHYAEAIDDAISVLNECEEIVHCKGCRYRNSYGECCRFDDWNPHETGNRDYCSWGLEKQEEQK